MCLRSALTKPERIAAALEAVRIQTAGSLSRREMRVNPQTLSQKERRPYNAYGYPNQIKLTFHGVSETDSHRMKTVVLRRTCPDKRPLGLPIPADRLSGSL